MSSVGITVLKNDVPWGPFNAGQIQDGLRRGDFTLLTPARGPETNEWRPLGEVLKQLEAPKVVLPPVPTGRVLPPVPGYVPPSAALRGAPTPPPHPPIFSPVPSFQPLPIPIAAPAPAVKVEPPPSAKPEPPPMMKTAPPPLSQQVSTTSVGPVPANPVPARFFSRFMAFVIDVIVLFAPVLVLFGLGALTVQAQGMAEHADSETTKQSWDLLLRNFRELLVLVAIGGAWLYAALLECSRWQATVGKQWVGLKVVDQKGERLTFFHATGRHAAKFISALPLFLGFAMALFSPTGQAWHDRIAGTRVVKKAKS